MKEKIVGEFWTTNESDTYVVVTKIEPRKYDVSVWMRGGEGESQQFTNKKKAIATAKKWAKEISDWVDDYKP